MVELRAEVVLAVLLVYCEPVVWLSEFLQPYIGQWRPALPRQLLPVLPRRVLLVCSRSRVQQPWLWLLRVGPAEGRGIWLPLALLLQALRWRLLWPLASIESRSSIQAGIL